MTTDPTQGPAGSDLWGSPDSPPGPSRTGTSAWGPPPEPGSPQRKTGDDFFARIREFGAYRPAEGRWGAGVATGLARRLDIDQTLIRGIFVALTVVGGLGVALYGLCWMFLPQQDGRIHLQEAMRGRFSPGFFAAAFMSAAAIGGGGPWQHGPWFWGFPGTLILSLLIVLGVWWMAKTMPAPDQPSVRSFAPTTPTTPAQPAASQPVVSQPAVNQPAGGQPGWQPSAHEAAAIQRHEAKRLARARSAPSKRVRQLTLGLALVAAATVLGIEAVGDLPGWAGLTALAAAITVIALGVLANGLLGRRSPGLAGLGILLAIPLALGTAAQHAGVDTTEHLAVVGQTTWTPQSRAAAETQYNLGVGNATLNLTSAAALAGATAEHPLEVEANVGIGEFDLNVPAWLPVQVEARLGAGEVKQPDGTTYEVKKSSDERSRTLTYGSGTPVVKVIAQQGLGQLVIRRIEQNQTIPQAPSAPSGVLAPSAPKGSN